VLPREPGRLIVHRNSAILCQHQFALWIGSGRTRFPLAAEEVLTAELFVPTVRLGGVKP
jgi:hypothetical protein